MKVGIAILPGDELIESVIELQRRLLTICSMTPILGFETNIPHITLLQGRSNDMDLLGTSIGELSEQAPGMASNQELSVTKFYYQPPGWYFLGIVSTPFIRQAHDFLFDRVRSSMILLQEDMKTDISSYTDLEKANYLTYGYRYIGQSFRPHITIGRTSDRSRSATEKEMLTVFRTTDLSHRYRIQKITLYAMGDNGSHATTLNEVTL